MAAGYLAMIEANIGLRGAAQDEAAVGERKGAGREAGKDG
jgi:hypothetical protein